MEITWKYVKPLANADAVKCFLKEHNVVLPQGLVDIIEAYNGGRPSEKDIITADEREYVFKSLLSYNANDLENIYDVYPLFEKCGLFPIASDAAGNFICYDAKLEVLVLYCHESEDTERIVKAAALGV